MLFRSVDVSSQALMKGPAIREMSCELQVVAINSVPQRSKWRLLSDMRRVSSSAMPQRRPQGRACLCPQLWRLRKRRPAGRGGHPQKNRENAGWSRCMPPRMPHQSQDRETAEALVWRRPTGTPGGHRFELAQRSHTALASATQRHASN